MTVMQNKYTMNPSFQHTRKQHQLREHETQHSLTLAASSMSPGPCTKTHWCDVSDSAHVLKQKPHGKISLWPSCHITFDIKHIFNNPCLLKTFLFF